MNNLHLIFIYHEKYALSLELARRGSGARHPPLFTVNSLCRHISSCEPHNEAFLSWYSYPWRCQACMPFICLFSLSPPPSPATPISRSVSHFRNQEQIRHNGFSPTQPPSCIGAPHTAALQKQGQGKGRRSAPPSAVWKSHFGFYIFCAAAEFMPRKVLRVSVSSAQRPGPGTK